MNQNRNKRQKPSRVPDRVQDNERKDENTGVPVTVHIGKKSACATVIFLTCYGRLEEYSENIQTGTKNDRTVIFKSYNQILQI